MFSFIPIAQTVPQVFYVNTLPINIYYFYSNQVFFEKGLNLNENQNQKKISKAQTDLPKQFIVAKNKTQKKLAQISSTGKFQNQTEKRIQQTQQEYKPSELKKPRKNSKKTYQSLKRNVLPNIIHQIFCFIHKQRRSGEVVKKYLSKIQESQMNFFNIDRFYRYQKLIKEKRNHYMNMKGLIELNRLQEPECQIYSQIQQNNFMKMNRILIKYFLEHQFENIILTSSRMSSIAKTWNFQTKRQILESISQLFQEC